MKFKSRYVKIGICIFIFLALIGVSNSMLRPVYNKIGSQISSVAQSYSLKFQEKTGLKISYKSLSPSVLGGINIRGISVYDTESGLLVASVQRLSLGYSFRKIIKGQIKDSPETLTLRDVTLLVNRGKNDFWLKKISGKADEGDAASSGLASATFDPDNIDFTLPADIKIFRLRAEYISPEVEVLANISKGLVSGARIRKIDSKLTGVFDVKASDSRVKGELDFSATVPVKLDGSSAVLRFSNIQASDYRMRYIGFFAEYRQKVFKLKMLPSARNLYMEAAADFTGGDVSGRVFADGFNLGDLIQTSRKDTFTRDLFAMNFSFKAEGACNYKTGALSYKSAGDIFVPGIVIPSKAYQSDFTVSYSLSGNEKSVDVPYFRTSGDRYNMDFSGSFNFLTKQPSGTLTLQPLVLPNGGQISADIYIDPLEKGFMCFAPQINFGSKALTAAQFTVLPSGDSTDFTFEVSDYARSDEVGTVSVFGSYAPGGKSSQLSVSFDTIYLDSLVELSAFFATEQLQPIIMGAADFARPFVFSGAAYASVVGTEFSFNVPYTILANTEVDNQVLILAADGNQDTVRITNLDFAFGGQHLVLDADSERLPKNGGRIFSGRMMLNDIPYQFSGLKSDNLLTVNSEYGFQFSFGTDTSGGEAVINGSLNMAGFPIRIGSDTAAVTTQTYFSYSLSEGLNATVSQFDGRLLEGSSSLNPAFSFMADINSTGAYFDSIAYSDTVSTLNGTGSCIWNVIKEEEKRDFDGASFNFHLSNSAGLENVVLTGDISNPLNTEVSMDKLFSGKLFKDLFFTLGAKIEGLRSERFLPSSRESDTVNIDVNMQGNLENPFVALNIPRAVFTLNNVPLILNAQAVIEDQNLSVQKASIDFGATQIKNVTARFSFRDWLGKLNLDAETSILGSKIIGDATVNIQSLSEAGHGIPESLSMELDINRHITGKKPELYNVTVLKTGDDLILSSSENIGLGGTIQKFRDVNIQINNQLPFKMNISGSADRDNLSLAFSGIEISLPKLLKKAGIDMIVVKEGTATGNFVITGPLSNPGFYGALDIIPAEFNFPSFFTKYAKTKKMTLVMSDSQFYTEPTRCTLHKTPVDVTVNVQMNRLAFEGLDVRVQTVDQEYAPLNLNLDEMHVKGDFQTDLTISLESGAIGVSGNLVAKNTNAEFGATRLNEIMSGFSGSGSDSDDEEGMPVDVSLHIKMQKRVQISYTTFLRAVVVPGSEIDVTFLGEEKKLLLNGDIPIRSGEIIYLNSSFYINEGEIHFSDNDESFDPRITIRAELKTHDENNENVTISLSAENQHLSELRPRLSATPAKSERELLELLGGVITGNSSNAAALALATGDYAIQTVFVRRLENALRDFFNFDIFSVRTMVVQNAVKQGFNRNSSGSDNLAGNYLDGTTVYIGKYFGDSIFGDASLRLSYDKNRVNDEYTYQGLSFRPELGFELESPFAKIRWSMSPDFEALRNMKLVENTSLTLSWKFSF